MESGSNCTQTLYKSFLALKRSYPNDNGAISHVTTKAGIKEVIADNEVELLTSYG
jgi:hypothetical protein